MEKYIINGPCLDDEFKEDSLGKFIHRQLSLRKSSDIILVDVACKEELTAEEVIADSFKLARALTELGLKRTTDVVAVVSPNSTRYLITMLSTLYVGATVCAVNPSYSSEEFLHCFEISQPKFIFVTSSLLPTIQTARDKLDNPIVIILDGDTEDENSYSYLVRKQKNCKEFRICDPEPDQQRFIFYSSGTTGKPKGVIITENNFKHSLFSCVHPDVRMIHRDSTVLEVLPMFHIFGIVAALGNLSYAKKMIVLDRFNPDTFISSIDTYKTTMLYAVPTMISFLCNVPLAPHNLKSLTEVLVGGSPMSVSLKKAFTKKFSHINIRTVYGLTEVSGPLASTFEASNNEGKIVAGLQAKIIDCETEKAISPDKTGEICVKGALVMKGYKNNEQATKESFTKDGWLRTGDVGYFDNDENLYVIDRMKELIKYKGFQVSPVQLEEILAQHPSIKDVAVIGKDDDRYGELPTAFVVKKESADATSEDILDFLAGRVSKEKQLYGGVIFIKEIPRNKTGKILRRELKKLF